MSITVAIKQLIREKRSFFITTIILSFLFTLFLTFQTLTDTIVSTNFSHPLNSKGQLWISAKGTDRPEGLFFKKEYYYKLKKLSIFDEVQPVIETQAFLKFKDKRMPVLLSTYRNFGLTRPNGLIKGYFPPWQLHKGIIIDKSILTTTSLDLGDVVKIGNFDFEISGFTEGHNYFLTPVVFVPYSVLDMDSGNSKFISFALAKVKKGVSFSEAKRNIQKILPNSRLQTKKEYVDWLVLEFSYVNSVILALELILSLIIILVLNLTMLNHLLEDRVNLAILKCIGKSNGYLRLLVLTQSFLISLVGLLLAALWLKLIIFTVGRILPVDLSFSIGSFIFVFIAMTLISFIVSLFASKVVSNVDPIEATKAL